MIRTELKEGDAIKLCVPIAPERFYGGTEAPPIAQPVGAEGSVVKVVDEELVIAEFLDPDGEHASFVDVTTREINSVPTLFEQWTAQGLAAAERDTDRRQAGLEQSAADLAFDEDDGYKRRAQLVLFLHECGFTTRMVRYITQLGLDYRETWRLIQKGCQYPRWESKDNDIVEGPIKPYFWDEEGHPDHDEWKKTKGAAR